MSPTPRSQKETEMHDNELDSLKIMPLNGIKRKQNVLSAGHRALVGTEGVKSFAELHRMHLQIPSPKTTKSLSLNHRRKEGLPSLIQGKRIELLCLK